MMPEETFSESVCDTVCASALVCVCVCPGFYLRIIIVCVCGWGGGGLSIKTQLSFVYYTITCFSLHNSILVTAYNKKRYETRYKIINIPHDFYVNQSTSSWVCLLIVAVLKVTKRWDHPGL